MIEYQGGKSGRGRKAASGASNTLVIRTSGTKAKVISKETGKQPKKKAKVVKAEAEEADEEPEPAHVLTGPGLDEVSLCVLLELMLL